MQEALSLYDVIGKYLPPNLLDLDVLEYSKQILDNIFASGDYNVFMMALGRMSGEDFTKIVSMDAIDRTRLFVECVAVNRLWLLDSFLKGIGYGTS